MHPLQDGTKTIVILYERITSVQDISKKGTAFPKGEKNYIRVPVNQTNERSPLETNTGKHPKSTSKMAVFRIVNEYLDESNDERNTLYTLHDIMKLSTVLTDE